MPKPRADHQPFALLLAVHSVDTPLPPAPPSTVRRMERRALTAHGLKGIAIVLKLLAAIVGYHYSGNMDLLHLHLLIIAWDVVVWHQGRPARHITSAEWSWISGSSKKIARRLSELASSKDDPNPPR